MGLPHRDVDLLSPDDVGASDRPVAVFDSRRTRLRRFVGLGTVAQVVVVIAAHVSDDVLTVSGILGTGIPFVLGLWYGATVPDARKDAVTGGFLIGIVGAAAGTVVAILLGDQTWMHLTFAPAAAAITGLLGGVAGTGRRAATERPPSGGATTPEDGVDAA